MKIMNECNARAIREVLHADSNAAHDALNVEQKKQDEFAIDATMCAWVKTKNADSGKRVKSPEDSDLDVDLTT